jgi:DNA-binding transcriptional MocR family regulator
MGEMLSLPLLEDLLDNWAIGDGPLYRRMADRFRVAIESGRLGPGTMLPPERQLADTLSVSRSTVVAAFEDLKRTGHLEARQGSGTWVRGRARPADEGNRKLVEQLDEHAIVRDLSGAPAGTIEFTAAAVDCAPEVTNTLAALDPQLLERWSVGHGYSPQGHEGLREVVAQRLTSIGLPTSASEVLITGGATQALLLAARLYLEPGAPAVLETPSYAGAIDVLHAAGARLLSVDRDASGARTDQLADVVARSLPRLVYLVPDFHNPTGGVLAERRREEVAQLAGDFHVPVVEDIVQRELWFDRPPPPPIASYAPDAPILTVGSMSKVFWGGLRIGWMRGSRDVIARLARMKAVTDFGVPMFAQLLSAQLLPSIDTTAAWRRRDLAGRLDVLSEALDKHLPEWRFERPAGGLSIWAKLPSPTADELVRRAVVHGVSVVPGSTFAVDHRRHTDRIRLPFVAPPDVIEEGVRRLAEAWDGVDQTSGRRAAPSVVI